MPSMDTSELGPGSPAGDAKKDPTSRILAEILAEVPRGRVSAGWVVERLQGRAFGVLLVVLGALAVVPGIATLAALLLIPPAIQMISGRTVPVLPAPVRRLSAPSRSFSGDLPAAIVRWVARLERIFGPRLEIFTRPLFVKCAGTIVLGLALAALCPVPVFHIVPAVAVIVIALGLLEQDGLALLAGMVLGAGAIFAGYQVWRLVVLAVAGLWTP